MGLNPEPVEIKQLLKTLIRISRHSFEMANSVFTCPGLLNAVRSLRKNYATYYFLLKYWECNLLPFTTKIFQFQFQQQGELYRQSLR